MVKNLPLNPNTVTPTSKKVVFWMCSQCGYEWKSMICTRISRKERCPGCMSNIIFEH